MFQYARWRIWNGVVMFLSSSKQKPDNEVGQIGALLRQSREAHSENLDDIAAHLRIDPAILSALEEGRVKDLPGWARAIGALRSYAEYLELDASPLVVRYRKIMAEPAGYAAKPARQPEAQPAAPKPVAPSAPAPQARAKPPMPKHKTPRGLVFAVTVFIGIAVFAGIYLSSSPAPDTDVQQVSHKLKAMLDRTIGAADKTDPPEEASGEAKVKTQTKPLPGLGPEQAGGGDPGSEPGLENVTAKPKTVIAREIVPGGASVVPGNSVRVNPVDRLTQARDVPSRRITLRASEAVWVRIADANGKSVMTREMKPGELYLVPDEKGLVLEVRNAGALDLFVNGNLIGKLGKAGEVITGFGLDAALAEKSDG